MSTINKDKMEDVELLLPWHAAGTLSRQDADRVENALASDYELSVRYAQVRDELATTIRLNESLGAPSTRAMQTLFAKISAEPVRKPKRQPFSLSAWSAGLFSGLSSRTLAYSAVVGALVIVLQGGVLTSLIMQEYRGVDEFKVASGDHTRSIDLNAPAGSFVLIRFNANANAAAITRFLQENNALIVNGPVQGTGVYRLRVADSNLSDAEMRSVVNRLSQDSGVVGLVVPATHP